MATRTLRIDPVRVQRGFVTFFKTEVAGSVVLLVAAIVALVLANSGVQELYHEFWEIEIGFNVGDWSFYESLLHWIDDGLMAMFFFVVGLEIKREILVGELSSPRKAALPILAAVGGMAVPAIVYILLNLGGEGASGWGVPMATDIAFALGVLALLGSRIPAGLKVFLTAVAIADDIGAVLVIALFYTSEIHFWWLGVGVAFIALLIVFNWAGIDQPAPYFIVAAIVWFAFLHSGVHATIAGVLVALTIPARSKLRPMEFVEWAKDKLDEIEVAEVPGAHVLDDPAQQHCAFEIRDTARHVAAPLQRIEHAMLPFTTFIVLPLFALANAGVTLVDYDIAELLLEPVTIGIFLGLFLGKPLGIAGLTWLTVKLRIADLPKGVAWPHVVGAGILGGIGFTMSLFISNLAFRGMLLRAEAKLGILITSLLAGVVGYLFLRYVAPPAKLEDQGFPDPVADEEAEVA